jgi:hypothetical protein
MEINPVALRTQLPKDLSITVPSTDGVTTNKWTESLGMFSSALPLSMLFALPFALLVGLPAIIEKIRDKDLSKPNWHSGLDESEKNELLESFLKKQKSKQFVLDEIAISKALLTPDEFEILKQQVVFRIDNDETVLWDEIRADIIRNRTEEN